ncbi:hypothetical protein SynMITS9220_01916 [Synechococcus sp. MIT S9220]|nr:hypothetical protein SynMITS9220_01916 [Synechococcus sp. MIT S9220]
MDQKKARHPEDITHHMIRAAVALFIVATAAVTYWSVHNLKKDISVPKTEPMSQQAMPQNSSR